MSAIESLSTEVENVVLEFAPPTRVDWQKYTEPIVVETKDGLREYDVLCVASRDINGNICTVSKDNNVDSALPSDWNVNLYDAENDVWTNAVVIGADTNKTEEHDVISLQLAPDVSYHGPYLLQFSVNELYGPDGSTVTMSHCKYYGRGTGIEPEQQIDYLFDEPLVATTSQEQHQNYAEVVSLEDARNKRRLGHAAVAGL